MDISVVVPLYNEAESLPELAAWIERVMNEHGYTYEVLMINDGSQDNTVQKARELGFHHIVSFKQNKGLAKGFMA